MRNYAAIFDMDGTIVEDDFIYGAGFKMVLDELGAKNVPDIPHVGGIGVDENWPILFEKYNIKTSMKTEVLTSKVVDYFIKNVKLARIKKGFFSLANNLIAEEFTLALATSSVWRVADSLINELKLEDIFISITTGEEVGFKKPFPEIFDLASEKLSIPAKNCVVFEDSKAGVEAAQSAGMKVIGIYKDDMSNNLIGTDMLIKDFNEVTIEDINSLFGI